MVWLVSWLWCCGLWSVIIWRPAISPFLLPRFPPTHAILIWCALNTLQNCIDQLTWCPHGLVCPTNFISSGADGTFIVEPQLEALRGASRRLAMIKHCQWHDAIISYSFNLLIARTQLTVRAPSIISFQTFEPPLISFQAFVHSSVIANFPRIVRGSPLYSTGRLNTVKRAEHEESTCRVQFTW